MTGTPATAEPVLLYDGDCGFCQWSITHLRRLTRTSVTLTPWQAADLAAHGLTERQVTRAVQWIPPTGKIRSGHAAFAAWLRTAHGPWRAVGLLLGLPPVSCLARGVYRVIADHRDRIPGPWRNGAACRIQR